MHLGASGGAGDLTMTLDHATSSAMDVKMDTTDMSSLADRHWIPTRPIFIGASDTLDIAFPNASELDWGAEVIWRAK